MIAQRPAGWQCPWCGPDGRPVDFSLPLELRLCDACGSAQRAYEELPEASCLSCRSVERERGASGACLYCCRLQERQGAANAPRIASLRVILRRFVQEDYLGRRPWPGAEWAKGAMGNAFLGALEHLGCDPAAELRAAMEET